MTRDEWNELTEAIARASSPRGVDVPASMPVARETGSTARGEIEAIVGRVATEQAAVRERQSENVRPSTSRRSEASGSGSGDSTATDVLKTVGMVTGVGPIVTGLMKLFGGGSGDTPAPALEKYELPPALRVEAGLMPNRLLSQISYAQNAMARADAPEAAGASQPPSAPAAAPTIQINVNAMDSRSFMDHSDDIAQAVRAAMLRSHSLNDVVSEV